MHLTLFSSTVVIFFISVSCSLNPIPEGIIARSSLAQCISNAGKKIFKEGEIVLVSLTGGHSSQSTTIQLDHMLFVELFKNLQVSIIVKKTSRPSYHDDNYLKRIDSYVILIRDLTDLSKTLHELEQYSSWNPHAKFIVISVSKFNNNKAVASLFAQQLWEYKVTNGIIMLQSIDNKLVYETYSWFPFLDGSCGSTFNTTKLVDKCYFGTFTKRSDWFNYKVPTNLKGCAIKVRAVVWPPYVMNPSRKEGPFVFKDGIEVLIMNTMAKLANFSVIYSMSNVTQDWGSLDDNGTATGTLWHLKENEIDAAIGSFPASVQAQRYLDMIAYDMLDSLHWFVPRAETIPKWRYYLILSPEPIGIIFGLYILVSCCTWMLSLSESPKTRKTFSWCCLVVFGSMLNVPIRFIPKTGKVRSLLVLWFLVALHTNVMYQTSLTSVFARPVYQKQIDTFSEIIKNDLKLWFLPTHKRYFTNSYDKDHFEILQRWRDCDNMKVCMKRIVSVKDSAMCCPLAVMRYGSRNTYKNKWLLYYIKDPIVTYPLHILLRKGFPFQELFKNLIYRITSAGLVVHWENRILSNNVKSKVNFQETSSITLENMYVFLVLLGIGYFMGAVALIFEICVFKKMNKRQRN